MMVGLFSLERTSGLLESSTSSTSSTTGAVCLGGELTRLLDAAAVVAVESCMGLLLPRLLLLSVGMGTDTKEPAVSSSSLSPREAGAAGGGLFATGGGVLGAGASEEGRAGGALSGFAGEASSTAKTHECEVENGIALCNNHNNRQRILLIDGTFRTVRSGLLLMGIESFLLLSLYVSL